MLVRLSVSKVSGYLDEGLPVFDRVLVERHLEECLICPPPHVAWWGAGCHGLLA
jgi:hypothetical protein